jgi:hypothetical protein
VTETETKGSGCLATGAGFVVGFIATCAVAGLVAAGVSSAFQGEGKPAGVALIVMALGIATVSILQLRRDPVPFLQGAMIGAAVASLLVGICGATVISG